MGGSIPRNVLRLCTVCEERALSAERHPPRSLAPGGALRQGTASGRAAKQEGDLRAGPRRAKRQPTAPGSRRDTPPPACNGPGSAFGAPAGRTGGSNASPSPVATFSAGACSLPVRRNARKRRLCTGVLGPSNSGARGGAALALPRPHAPTVARFAPCLPSRQSPTRAPKATPHAVSQTPNPTRASNQAATTPCLQSGRRAPAARLAAAKASTCPHPHFQAPRFFSRLAPHPPFPASRRPPRPGPRPKIQIPPLCCLLFHAPRYGNKLQKVWFLCTLFDSTAHLPCSPVPGPAQPTPPKTPPPRRPGLASCQFRCLL
jgi:hypothetical protein